MRTKYACLILSVQLFGISTAFCAEKTPFDNQLKIDLELTASNDSNVRHHAVERLGLMRAFDSAEKLSELLTTDSDPQVRMQAAQSLSVCGTRNEISSLINALDDSDWLVRQAAGIALQISLASRSLLMR